MQFSTILLAAMAAFFTGVTNALPAPEAEAEPAPREAACPFRFCDPQEPFCPDGMVPGGPKDDEGCWPCCDK